MHVLKQFFWYLINTTAYSSISFMIRWCANFFNSTFVYCQLYGKDENKEKEAIFKNDFKKCFLGLRRNWTDRRCCRQKVAKSSSEKFLATSTRQNSFPSSNASDRSSSSGSWWTSAAAIAVSYSFDTQIGKMRDAPFGNLIISKSGKWWKNCHLHVIAMNKF